MAENESMQGKNLANDLSLQAKIEEAVKIAILQDKTNIILEDGRAKINLEIIKENDEKDRYNVRLGKTNLVTASKDKNGIVKFGNYKIDLKQMQNKIDVRNIEIRMQDEARTTKKVRNAVEDGKSIEQIDEETSKGDMALQMEVEQGLKNGNVVEMEMDREFSDGENMRMFVKRGFGVDAQQIYRDQGKDPHDFKYVAKTSKGYQEINLSNNEGTNTKQNIWVMHNGKLEEKEVAKIEGKGSYAIATEIPTSTASDNIRTYLAVRTPGEQYIAIAAGQKRGVNRNTSGNELQKDFMTRANSVYEIEDIAESAELAKKILNKGKLSAEEVEMVRKLKDDEGMSDKEIETVIDTVSILKNELGYKPNEIKEILGDVLKAPDSKEATIKLAKQLDEKERRNQNAKGFHDDHGDEERILGPKKH